MWLCTTIFKSFRLNVNRYACTRAQCVTLRTGKICKPSWLGTILFHRPTRTITNMISWVKSSDFCSLTICRTLFYKSSVVTTLPAHFGWDDYAANQIKLLNHALCTCTQVLHEKLKLSELFYFLRFSKVLLLIFAADISMH